MQTWDLDNLNKDQRALLARLCAANGSDFVSIDEWDQLTEVAHQLRRLGLIDIDGEQADEVHLGLTTDGEKWILSLPEGSLPL